MTSPTISRPECSVYIAASIDGFIAREGGELDWLSAFQQEGEDYGYARFVESVDVIVMGRRTYDVVLGFPDWPHAGKRCVVLTHRPPAPRHGEEFSEGDPAALVERLGRAGARRLYVDGADVIRQFLRGRLIDDLTLSVIPILLGRGIRLFGEGEPEQLMLLEETRSWPTGLAQLRYRMAQAA